jgi:hypothetical protein
MAPEKSQDESVLESLQTLGVALLPEWDALTFVYQRGASLCTAAQIARLIGYDKAETGAALQKLETLGLIERSRFTQAIRFYRLSELREPPAPVICILQKSSAICARSQNSSQGRICDMMSRNQYETISDFSNIRRRRGLWPDSPAAGTD